MTQISKSTSDEMVAKVGDIMDVEIDNNSTPSKTQVFRWLNEGQMRISRLMPVEHLGSITRSVTGSQVESDWLVATAGKSIIRIATIKKFGNTCTFLKPEEFEKQTTVIPYLYSYHDPCYTHTGLSGKSYVRFHPDAPGSVEARVVLVPTEYSESDQDGDDYRVPVSLEDFVVSFAVMRARQQDEEGFQADQMKQEWMTDLQFAFGIKSFAQDTVEA